MRPVWENEILGEIDGKSEVLYDILNPSDGNLIHRAKIALSNPIVKNGTKHTADNMNNLFDFDNIDSMSGNRIELSFPSADIILEEVFDSVSGVKNAERKTEILRNGNLSITTKVFSDNGETLLRETTVTTSFVNNKVISEVI